MESKSFPFSFVIAGRYAKQRKQYDLRYGERGVSPSEEQFERSLDAFIEVLEEYKPDLIIVWGARLWEMLPDIGRKGEENVLDNGNGQFYYFKVGDKEIPAYSIYHPSSSSFTYEHSKYLRNGARIRMYYPNETCSEHRINIAI